jgi:hypothetical protein
MNSPTSEPVVELAKASLTGRIRQVSLLIISDRPFQSDPDARIVHLDFPFDMDGLYDRVGEILRDAQMESGGETPAKARPQPARKRRKKRRRTTDGET